MIDSRNSILDAIDAACPTLVPHPLISPFPVPGDPLENFCRKLSQFDGRAIRFSSETEAIAWLANECNPENFVVCSAIEGIPGALSPEMFSDPHAANVVEKCVARGLLGVGETGSVWVTDKSLGSAAAALFSRDLYLLLPIDQIVPSIHDAYRLLPIRSSRYGAFFTGPSATADIEAIHITGAQGEISITVLLY